MKTLKIILAWLDWSSYCNGWDYNRPKTLCPLFWRTLFTIITLPLTYIAHVFNIFTSKEDFWDETSRGLKLHMGTASLLHLLIMLFGGIFLKDIIDKGLGWDWIRIADPIWVTYPKLLIAGILVFIGVILAFGIIIGVCYGIWYLGKLAYDKYQDGKPDSIDSVESEPSLITTAYKSIKDKYCPIIDWSDVEKS